MNRAWSATYPDGPMQDRFHDLLVSAITDKHASDQAAGYYSVELCEDFLARADAEFEHRASEEAATWELVERWAADTDTSDWYECVQIED